MTDYIIFQHELHPGT